MKPNKRKRPYPDFVIAGAPKCGTTALCQYLTTHPGVYLSKVKEPCYFATDLPGLRQVQDERQYMGLFAGADDSVQTGEASVWYLYSRDAVRNIRSVNPDTKFIVMLRNPVDMAHALHMEQLRIRNETVDDFAKAWALQDERKVGRSIPRLCRQPELLQYRDICALGSQVARLQEVVDPRRVHIVVFDDFVRKTQESYKAVLNFLDLADDKRTLFPRVNPSTRIRSPAVADFFASPPALFCYLRSALRSVGIRPGNVVHRLNQRITAREPVPAEVRTAISRSYTDEIRLVERLLQRQLGAWYAS
jgi:hypothetical protein